MNTTMGLAMVGAALCLFTGCASVSGGVEFADDVTFMKKHTPIDLLKDCDAAVAVAPDYQGRVMTSTFDHEGKDKYEHEKK